MLVKIMKDKNEFLHKKIVAQDRINVLKKNTMTNVTSFTALLILAAVPFVWVRVIMAVCMCIFMGVQIISDYKTREYLNTTYIKNTPFTEENIKV